MYNLDSHYQNILSFAKTIIADSILVYLHPFGSTQPENIESIGGITKGPLLIGYDQEPTDFNYNQELLDTIIRNFKDDHGYTRPTIFINTEKVSSEKQKILQAFNFYDVNYFFHGLCASDWYRGYRFDSSITSPSERKLTKKFITFNRITGSNRVYRTLLIGELTDVLDQGYVSYSEHCPVHDEYYTNALYAKWREYELDHVYIEKIINNLNKLNFPLRIDSDENNIPNGSYSIGPTRELMSSFLHIVTETMFWDERTHLTEKIFKPIVAKQPFVLVGCANNLEYLKSYGFKTFDRWWDESYDNIIDPIERIKAIAEIIKDICNKSLSELENILAEMNDVLTYNYNWFYSDNFINLIYNELTDNLKTVLVELRDSKFKNIAIDRFDDAFRSGFILGTPTLRDLYISRKSIQTQYQHKPWTPPKACSKSDDTI